MPTITLHRWIVTGRDGRRRPTRHLMTEADALATDRNAERIPGTEEVRHAVEQGHACIAGPSVQSNTGAGAVAAHQARAGCGRDDRAQQPGDRTGPTFSSPAAAGATSAHSRGTP